MGASLPLLPCTLLHLSIHSPPQFWFYAVENHICCQSQTTTYSRLLLEGFTSRWNQQFHKKTHHDIFSVYHQLHVDSQVNVIVNHEQIFWSTFYFIICAYINIADMQTRSVLGKLWNDFVIVWEFLGRLRANFLQLSKSKTTCNKDGGMDKEHWIQWIPRQRKCYYFF